MKNKSCFLYIFLVTIILAAGCQDKLIEHPKSLTPDFLKTAQGLKQGLDAAYAGNRNIWGPQAFFHLTLAGTDMWKRGVDGSSSINEYNSGYTSSEGNVNSVWNTCYTYINTCNAVIDFAPKVTGIDTATKHEMVGEAKFLRAQYYFILVRFWGDVTLNKNFQALPTTSAKRDPIADVYQFIIQDLKDAIQVLPPSPQLDGVLPGKATGAVARHLLAKVYLTRGYSSAKQADDFKNAAETATSLINDAPSLGLGLLQDFGDVFKEGNEANKEVLWSVQHTGDLAFNGSPKQDNRGPDNLLCHLLVPQYERQPGMQRSTLYGRPYIREVPTKWLLDTAFAERKNDTRYNKTFQTVWLCNDAAGIPVWPNPLPPGAPADAKPGQPKFALGDTAIYMPGHDVTDAQITAAPYLLIPPRKYAINLAPAMTKFFDTKRSDQNAPSIRPIIVYRLAGTYLIAAEALLESGNAPDAVKYINVVRERAAYPTGNAAAMDISASDLTLDYILDERARELCGELKRWPDLTRTHTLVKRVRLHNEPASPNIEPFDALRPIPQDQIDRVTTGPAYPQNPGW
jgi:hypothetical protein